MADDTEAENRSRLHERQETAHTAHESPAPQHCVVCGYNILTDRLDVVSDPEASSD